MSIHTLKLHRHTGAVNVYSNSVPSIPANSPLFIQNIGNTNVHIGTNANMEDHFIIGGKDHHVSISRMSINGEPTLFAECPDNNSATLTIRVGGSL